MKKAIVFIYIFTIIVSIVLIVLGFLNNHWNPFLHNININYPQYSIINENNNIFVIDTSFRRILVGDTEGNLLSLLEGGDRSEGSLFYARNIIAGENNNFFVLNYVLDDFGLFLLREEIIEYSLSGEFQRIIYQRFYNEKRSTLIQRGEIYSPIVVNEYVYFFLIDDSRIRMIRRSLNADATEILGSIEMDDANAFISDIEWIDDRNFLILDKRGYFIIANNVGDLRITTYQQEEQSNSQADINAELPNEYFSDFSISQNGNIYITDLINRRIATIPLGEVENRMNTLSFNPDSEFDQLNAFANTVQYSIALDSEILSMNGGVENNYIYYRVGNSPRGFVTPYDYGIYHGNDRGIQSYTSFRVPQSWILSSISRWIGFILLSISIIGIFIYIYLQVWKRKISILVKQLLVIVPLMFGGIVLMSNILLQIYVNQYQSSSIDKLLSLTQVISQVVDGDRFNSIRTISDYMNEDYRYIRSSLQESLNYNTDSWNEGLYFALYQVINETLYGFMYLNNEIGIRHPFTWYEDPESVYRSAYNGEVVFEQAEDISGNFLYAIAPILDSSGETVALLEVGSDLFSFEQNAQRIYRRASLFLFFIGASVIGFIMLMTFVILRNLGKLRRGVEKIAAGDWKHSINIKSNDELRELGDRFNYMSTSIDKYLKQIAVLNESYQKFFPDEFLQHLDLESVSQVKLGDQVRKEMSILFSDIRSFTSISEKLGPEDNFNFLNNYLKLVGPIIRKHNGFVDKFIGDAVMALFARSPTDAVKSAIDMMQGLKEFNNTMIDKSLPRINIGIGIHTGSLMLGVLGDQQRMEGTVIADSVNLASRLESLTKQVGASIIMSQDSLNEVDENERFLRRYLGRIQVSGKNDAVRVYEILSGLPEDELESKLKHKPILSEGIQLYEKGEMQQALSNFITLQGDPFHNKIATLYLLYIENYYKQQEIFLKKGQNPPLWNTVIKIPTK